MPASGEMVEKERVARAFAMFSGPPHSTGGREGSAVTQRAR